MSTVLYLGRSDRRIEAWARAHARFLAGVGGRVVFVALYGDNYIDGNFRFINCHSIREQKSIQEIQAVIPVSINRALACDRSLTDYSHSTSYHSYSRYSSAQIETLAAALGTGVLSVIDEVDYCVDGLFDNFITPLAFEIAASRGKKFYLIRTWHFWHDRFHLVDAPGYTSSLVDDYYRRYLRRLPEAAVPRVLREFLVARFRPGAFANEDWRFRLRIVRDKIQSYERPALRNLIRRRWSRFIGPLFARGLRFLAHANRPHRYIVFALHVMPEASILGTDPEIADQFSLIRRLSMNVPAGVQILCKAHPGDRFGRDLEIGFLKRLCTLHNVALVPANENIGSFFSDPRCLAVATINGSVAIESIMESKPCFLFGKGIFAAANCFLKPSSDQEFFEQVSALVAGTYRLDLRSFAAMVLALKRGSIEFAMSLRTPGTWLELYSSFVPAIHRYHLRFAKRKLAR